MIVSDSSRYIQKSPNSKQNLAVTCRWVMRLLSPCFLITFSHPADEQTADRKSLPVVKRTTDDIVLVNEKTIRQRNSSWKVHFHRRHEARSGICEPRSEEPEHRSGSGEHQHELSQPRRSTVEFLTQNSCRLLNGTRCIVSPCRLRTRMSHGPRNFAFGNASVVPSVACDWSSFL